jgi:hypothetical protein
MPISSQVRFLPGASSPAGRRLRVIGKRDDEADQAPVLVVEDVA